MHDVEDRFGRADLVVSNVGGVDVTDTFDAGVRSLACHRVSLDNLGGEMATPDAFLRGPATAAGPRLGVALATTFEVIR